MQQQFVFLWKYRVWQAQVWGHSTLQELQAKALYSMHFIYMCSPSGFRTTAVTYDSTVPYGV